METSILKDVKHSLGVADSYDVFDSDIIMAINTALSTVTQLGVGSILGFEVRDNTATWDQLLGGDPRLNAVKNFVTLSTKLIFDPPATSFAITAIENQLREMAWRIEIAANPAPPVLQDVNIYVELDLDGGAP